MLKSICFFNFSLFFFLLVYLLRSGCYGRFGRWGSCGSCGRSGRNGRSGRSGRSCPIGRSGSWGRSSVETDGPLSPNKVPNASCCMNAVIMEIMANANEIVTVLLVY